MVTEYVSGLKVAWDMAKALKAATDSIDDAQIKLQMEELINALADAKIEAAENAETIAGLKQQLKDRSAMVYRSGLYYVVDKETKSTDGPFCPTCKDSDEKKIRLREHRGDSFNWRCNVCTNVFW